MILLAPGQSKTNERKNKTDYKQNKEKPMACFDFVCKHFFFTLIISYFWFSYNVYTSLAFNNF